VFKNSVRSKIVFHDQELDMFSYLVCHISNDHNIYVLQNIK